MLGQVWRAGGTRGWCGPGFWWRLHGIGPLCDQKVFGLGQANQAPTACFPLLSTGIVFHPRSQQIHCTGVKIRRLFHVTDDWRQGREERNTSPNFIYNIIMVPKGWILMILWAPNFSSSSTISSKKYQNLSQCILGTMWVLIFSKPSLLKDNSLLFCVLLEFLLL